MLVGIFVLLKDASVGGGRELREAGEEEEGGGRTSSPSITVIKQKSWLLLFPLCDESVGTKRKFDLLSSLPPLLLSLSLSFLKCFPKKK